MTNCGSGTSYYKYPRSSAQYQYICYLSCPSDFWYDEDSKKCYDTYDAATYIVENTSKKVISSCSDYKYSEGKYNFFCEKCPDSAPYYYEDSRLKTCYKECSGTYNILIESTKKMYKLS